MDFIVLRIKKGKGLIATEEHGGRRDRLGKAIQNTFLSVASITFTNIISESATVKRVPAMIQSGLAQSSLRPHKLMKGCLVILRWFEFV